jgi:hypothetical protein
MIPAFGNKGKLVLITHCGKSGKKMQVSGFNSNNTKMKYINSPIRFAPETKTYF